jgi:Polyketide cyclase / dehydrase and lipid transport
MRSNDYHFTDRWRVIGTVKEVADILDDPEDYPRWWSSVYRSVRITHPGENRIGQTGSVLAQGWLPYRIRFDYRVSESRYPHGFTIEAHGDLNGRGVWTLEQDGEHVNMLFDWTVRADKPILRYLSFLLKPLFRTNHTWTMRQGEQSLELELQQRRVAKCRAHQAQLHVER